MPYYVSKSPELDCPSLTREQETALFRTFYAYKGNRGPDGLPQPSGLTYPGPVERRAFEARDVLINSYLKLVIQMAVSFAKNQIPDDMAVSAGNYALMRLLHRRSFDPTKGQRFSTFLHKHIHGEIWDAILDFREHEGRVVPELDDDGELLGVMGVGMFTPPTVEEHMLNLERRKKIETAMTWMTKTEKIALIEVGMNGRTCAEVAAELNISRQGLHQAYQAAATKLRRIFTEYKHNTDLVPTPSTNDYRTRHKNWRFHVRKHPGFTSERSNGGFTLRFGNDCEALYEQASFQPRTKRDKVSKGARPRR